MSLVPLGTTGLRVLFAVQGWLEKLSKKPLRAELRPFSEQGFLAAYEVRLTNIEQELIHVADVVMTMPAQAQFALRWNTPFMIIGGQSSPDDPWEYGHRLQIDTDLDPNEDVGFDLAVPSGFAIGPSRAAPIVIRVNYETRGARQKRGHLSLVRRLLQP
jgi:hypothetical protein